MKTKIGVTSNLGTIGFLSPYSYQVRAKIPRNPIRVEFDGAVRPGSMTSGRGKGEKMRFYAYFLVGDFQHWVELTGEAFTTLSKDPAAKLVLTPKVVPVEPTVEPTEVAAPTEAAAPAPAPTKGKRVHRVPAAA